MNKPKFIVLTGVDGSGKTTIAKLLIEQLRSKGCRPVYVWIKSLHSVVYLISRIFEYFGLVKTILNPNGIAVRRVEPTGLGSFRRLWPFLEFISVLPWVILKVYLPLFLSFTVVADRYTIDTVVTVAIRVGNLNFPRSFLGRLMLKMIPKGNVIIQLDVDVDTLLKRRYDVEYTLQEIKDQRALYKSLAKGLHTYTLDTTILPASETLRKIINELSL